MRTPEEINVLIACEESQAVCKEFRARGFRAFSCDILPCSGGHPEWHIQRDVRSVMNGKCRFKTQDRKKHGVGEWDLIIAHPPCTHLATSGARHFTSKRADGRQHDAIILFCIFFHVKCKHVAIENPVNIIGGGGYLKKIFPELAEIYHLPRRPDQSTQPFEHGDPFRKKTMLWLKNLPKLMPTRIVEPKLKRYVGKDGKLYTFSEDYGGGSKGHGARRSKTYPGIAAAMAQQWGDYLIKEVNA